MILIRGITEHALEVQKVLWSDARMNSPKPNVQRALMVDAQPSFPNLQQREAKIRLLQAKWESKGDSEQKRKISDLIFVDFSTLGKANLAILDDNLAAYKEEWGREESRWGRNLELACLAGSRDIGEFIISQKEINLSAESWGVMLSYVSTSGNNAWTEACANRMHEKGMSMPQEFCSFCDDFALIDKVSNIFAEKEKPKPD